MNQTTREDYDYSTDEVSNREIIKFVTEELNRYNYYKLEGNDESIFLIHRETGNPVATVSIKAVVEVIKNLKRNKRNS